MQQARFSSGDAIATSWKVVKHYMWVFSLMTLAIVGGALIIVLFGMALGAEFELIALLFLIGAYLYVITCMLGLSSMGLHVADNKEWDFSILFSQFKRMLPFIGAAILYTLMIMGGLILLILPGIYWATRFQFFAQFIVDKGESPMQALKSSWALTENSFWDLFGYQYARNGVVWLLILPLGLGLLVLFPMFHVMHAHVYRSLLAHPAK